MASTQIALEQCILFLRRVLKSLGSVAASGLLFMLECHFQCRGERQSEQYFSMHDQKLSRTALQQVSCQHHPWCSSRLLSRQAPLEARPWLKTIWPGELSVFSNRPIEMRRFRSTLMPKDCLLSCGQAEMHSAMISCNSCFDAAITKGAADSI